LEESPETCTVGTELSTVISAVCERFEVSCGLLSDLQDCFLEEVLLVFLVAELFAEGSSDRVVVLAAEGLMAEVLDRKVEMES
jgi:hypothetical protein